MKYCTRILVLSICLGFLALLIPCLPAKAVSTELISVASDGTQGNWNSVYPSISSDGRYVAFAASSTNLVPGDTNDRTDIFVHDRQTGVTERVSVSSDGTQANGHSSYLSISSDCRFVAFDSAASNLVASDTNGKRDVFVHDRQTGVTERVSVASDGTEGNKDSQYPSISADGRYVAFSSSASNLVPGVYWSFPDIFVHDRETGVTERVSIDSNGTQLSLNDRPSISTDGTLVAFSSRTPNNNTGIFVHDRETGVTEIVSVSSAGTQESGTSEYPSISADGRYVAFHSSSSNLVAGDTNGYTDIFVHDRQTGVTERVSVASNGTQGDYVSWSPTISADGRYVAFYSLASNLVRGDTGGYYDTFIRDRQTGVTEMVSVSSNGTQANFSSHECSISADGRFVAFWSEASNLVPDDINRSYDVFVRDRFPMLVSSVPTSQQSLWRSQKNIIRFTFNEDITAPSAGNVTICEMLSGGAYGPDLSSGFTFTVENDGNGHPRILKIRENASTLVHRKWYAIRNTGGWSAANNFTVQYVVQVGDASNDGRVLAGDVSTINAGIPTNPALDNDRRDINGDGRVLAGDVSIANSKIPSNAVTKPNGH